MQLSSADVQRAPDKALAPLCLLFGHEPLLIEESADAIRAAAVAAGVAERLSFTAQTRPKFDWDQLRDLTATGSLFASQRLVEVRLTGAGPGVDGGKFIDDFVRLNPPDIRLLLLSGPLDKRTQNTKWFKAVDANGVVVNHAQVTPERMPAWVNARLRSHGLSCDDGVVERLAHLLEGNLLAAAQEINKLILLVDDKFVSDADVDRALSDHARFDVFSFVDCFLTGNLPRALRMLAGLRREGIEPVLVIWSLGRECRLVQQVAVARERGEQAGAVFRRLRIWKSRETIMRSAVKRCTLTQWREVVQRICALDRMLKGREMLVSGASVWDEIERLTVQVSQGRAIGADAPYAVDMGVGMTGTRQSNNPARPSGQRR